MKKIGPTIFITAVVLLLGCGNDPREIDAEPISQEAQSNDSLDILEGDFIYLSNAAVLKGEDFIYGVQIDSTSLQLAEDIAPLKNNEFDMIPVKVKAKILPNPGVKGWDQIAHIIDVMEIPDAPADTTTDPSRITNELKKP